LANLALFALAVAAWVAVAFVLLTLDPLAHTGVLLTGALLLGTAVSLSLAPLLWLGGFVLRGKGIAYKGDWWRASARSLLAGLVVALLVALRGEGLLTTPLALFVIGMSILVEVTLWFRRSLPHERRTHAPTTSGGTTKGLLTPGQAVALRCAAEALLVLRLGTGGSPRVRSVMPDEHATPDF